MAMDPGLVSIVLLVGVLLLLVVGVPIYAGLGLAGTVGVLMLRGPDGLSAIPTYLFPKIGSFVMVAIPLFILMGETIFVTGIGAELYTLFSRWLNRLPGALAMSSVGACAVFGAMCGVSTAGVATIGVIAVPEMLKRGYDARLATGSVAAAGALAILIPPSVPFILYGAVADVSVGKLFIAGIVPGIVLAVMMMIYIGVLCWIRPRFAPPLKETVTWKSRFAAVGRVWASVVLIVIVLGAIYAGITTPTEAAAAGSAGALLLALLAYRKLSLRAFLSIVRQTTVTTGLILWIVGGAMVFGYALTLAQTPQGVSAFVAGLGLPYWGLLVAVNLILLIAGMFLELASMVLLTTPILLPVMIAAGADPIWYGVMLVLQGEMAVITPPVGLNIFVMKGITPPNISLTTILEGAMPFVGVELACIVLVIVFPGLVLWLPNMMMR